jgi:hypothetical protein
MIPALIPAWFYHVNKPAPLFSAWLFFCLYFYAFQFLIRVPAYLLLNRKKAHPILAYLILGFAAVALPATFWVLLKWPPHQDYNLRFVFFMTFLYQGLLGAAVALIFWILARPDRRTAVTP